MGQSREFGMPFKFGKLGKLGKLGMPRQLGKLGSPRGRAFVQLTPSP